MVLWLTQKLHDLPHLQKKNAESLGTMYRLLCLTHHRIGGVHMEEMVLEVKKGEDAATTPHVNAVAEGQAQEYFWRPEEGK